MNGLGERLKLARLASGISQQVLADRVALSCSAIKNYETGYSDPRLEWAAKLAEALGVSLNWLVYGNHPPQADRELMAKLIHYERKREVRTNG